MSLVVLINFYTAMNCCVKYYKHFYLLLTLLPKNIVQRVMLTVILAEDVCLNFWLFFLHNEFTIIEMIVCSWLAVISLIFYGCYYLLVGLSKTSNTQHNAHFFDTLSITPGDSVEEVKRRAEEKKVNLRYFSDGKVNSLLQKLFFINALKIFICVWKKLKMTVF